MKPGTSATYREDDDPDIRAENPFNCPDEPLATLDQLRRPLSNFNRLSYSQIRRVDMPSPSLLYMLMTPNSIALQIAGLEETSISVT